jgi:hypothetical protein
MLYWPWRNLVQELENGIVNHFELFEQHRNVIVENRMTFEGAFTDVQQEEFLKDMDDEIREYYEDLFHEDADTMNQADNILLANHDLRNDFDPDVEIDNEEDLLMEHGNHVPLIDDMFKLISSGLNSKAVGKANKRLNDDQYKKFMIELNDEQQLYLMNALSRIKNKEVFYDFITGSAGTGKQSLLSIKKPIFNNFNHVLKVKVA